jgi:hypothetical protein
MTTSIFATIRTKHSDYVRRCNAGQITPELVKEVEGFIEEVRLSGREVADEDDREYLRSLLTFWGNWYYNHTRKYPNTNLELVTPEAAAAHGREVAQKIVKEAKTPGSSTSNRWLIGAGVLVLGLVTLIAIAALGIAMLPLLIGGTMAFNPGVATELANAAVESTLTSIAATEHAQQSTSIVAEATQIPTATPNFTPTAIVGVADTSVPTNTSTPFATATVAAATPTSSGAGDEPTATPLPGVGGGGFVPQIGFLSIQIVEPSISDSLVTNQPFNIGAAYSNLQPGWTLFYILNPLSSGESIVIPETFEVGIFNGTGLWTESVQIDQPNLYTISVYIATTTESRAVLQRYADAGASLPPDLNLEGVITFYSLTTIQVN